MVDLTFFPRLWSLLLSQKCVQHLVVGSHRHQDTGNLTLKRREPFFWSIINWERGREREREREGRERMCNCSIIMSGETKDRKMPRKKDFLWSMLEANVSELNFQIIFVNFNLKRFKNSKGRLMRLLGNYGLCNISVNIIFFTDLCSFSIFRNVFKIYTNYIKFYLKKLNLEGSKKWWIQFFFCNKLC